MLPLSSEQFEQRRDYSLLIRSVTLRNLGPYTCQAYNGYGRAASWTVTVQAVGPVYSGGSAYNEYLVPPPRRPETSDIGTPTERPSYPYRPVRPSPQPQPRPISTAVQLTSPPEIPPKPVPELTPRVFTGKQRAQGMVINMLIIHKKYSLVKVGPMISDYEAFQYLFSVELSWA
jgi:hypothetical protein